jgi:hypothetical protein
MAEGGIAVSGGTTGYGTLISTNLLYAPLLLDASGNPLARPVVAIGGTAGATGFAAAFALDKDPKTLWKTAATGDAQTFTIDLGATGFTVYGVVVINHNIPTTGLTAATLDGGTTAACSDVSEALTLNADTYTPAYHLLTTPVAKRYWRLSVDFVASTALQIGEVFLIGAAPLAFTGNYSYWYDDHEEVGIRSSTGLSGVSRVTAQWVRRYMSGLQFNNISTAQKDAMLAAARNGHVVFSPDGANGKALFGVWKIESVKHSYDDQWNVTASFEESPR